MLTRSYAFDVKRVAPEGEEVSEGGGGLQVQFVNEGVAQQASGAFEGRPREFKLFLIQVGCCLQSGRQSAGCPECHARQSCWQLAHPPCPFNSFSLLLPFLRRSCVPRRCPMRSEPTRCTIARQGSPPRCVA